MIPILENIVKKIWSQKTLTEMAVDALELTDSSGDALTLANTQGKNQGLYKIAASGAGTEYFYYDVNGVNSCKLLGFKVRVDAAVTNAGILQAYCDGDWVDIPPYEFSFDATESQKMNGVYPLEEGIYGMPIRIKCTVGGACNVFAQAVMG